MSVPVTHEGWPQAHRIVSSRFPPIGVFDAVADPADLEALYWVEGLTNPRLRVELGALDLVPPEEGLAGPGTTPIMAAFTHFNAGGSRFSDGRYGVYYAGRTRETAVAETVFHCGRWAAESHDPATIFTMRVYVGRLHRRPFHDLRGTYARAHPGFFDPDPAHYAPAQAFAADLRAGGSPGLLYPSVRHIGGECVAALRPSVLGPVKQGAHLAYHWDGRRIVDVIELRPMGVPGRPEPLRDP